MPLAAVARALTDECQFITTNDGVPLAYDSLGKSGPVIVLLHGWSGSRHYFELNARVSARSAGTTRAPSSAQSGSEMLNQWRLHTTSSLSGKSFQAPPTSPACTS